tara:strand:+ start:194 stop:1222 length:1029 start_codon:yes stop_codon:yes gene_type:complete
MFIARGSAISEMHFYFNKKNSLSQKNLAYFSYSREAILEILEMNKICDGDEVLLPDYLCSTVIESILSVTSNIIFYKINDHLAYDNSEIIGLLTDKTKLIFFVDYFGVETQLDQSIELILKNKGIIIVKDSAHAFLSLVNRNFDNDYSYDYLISSVYKNLPCQVGAIAIGNFKERNDFISFYMLIKRCAVLIIKNVIYIFGQQKFINKNLFDMSVSDSDVANYSFGLNIAKLYKSMLHRLNLKKIIDEKKTLIVKFNSFFFDRPNLRPIFNREQMESSILQDYPLLFPSQATRDEMLKLLLENSIDAYTWPTFHHINCDDVLWSKVLLVPINKKTLKVLKGV